MSNIKASEVSTWLNTLNTIRASHGLTAMSMPLPSVGSKILGSTLTTLRNNIYSTYNSETHLRTVLLNIQGNFTAGTKIQSETRNTMTSELNKLLGICHNNPCTVNNVCSNVSVCSNSYTTNTNYGQCSTCSTSGSNSTGGGDYFGSNSNCYDNDNCGTCTTNSTNNNNSNCITTCSNSTINATNANYGQYTTYTVNSNTLPMG